jgi:hypothetical protein
MSIPPAWPRVLDFFGRALVLEPSDGQLSSDAGLLPLRPFDDRVGLTRACTDALDDPRDPDLTEHTFLEMFWSRVYGILAGYEDQNDHATLRADPVLELVADRSPEDDDLASQPTLSRFENAISLESLERLRDIFLDQWEEERFGQGAAAGEVWGQPCPAVAGPGTDVCSGQRMSESVSPPAESMSVAANRGPLYSQIRSDRGPLPPMNAC